MAFGDFKGVPFLDNSPTPEPTTIGLDKDTTDLIQQKYEQAMKDPAAEQAQHMAQIDKAAGDVYKGYLGNDAIKTKYGRLLTAELGDLKNQSKNDLRERQRNRYKMAQQAVLAQQQVANDAFARQMEAYNQREAARSQAISSIIGAGAMIGGYALAGPGQLAAPKGLEVGPAPSSAPAGGTGYYSPTSSVQVSQGPTGKMYSKQSMYGG